MSNLLAVTTDTFEAEVTGSDLPVIIDFWAPWCGPCIQLGPHLERVASEYEGKVKVVKIDMEANRSLAQQFNVRSIPCLVAISAEGEIVDRSVGFDGSDKAIRKLFGKIA